MNLCPCAEALKYLGEHLDNTDPRQAADGLGDLRLSGVPAWGQEIIDG